MNTLLISATKLDRIQQCEELFRYSYVKEITTIERKKEVEEGDLLHKLLQYYYVQKKQDPTYHPRIDDIVEIGRNYATNLSLPTQETEEMLNLFKDYILYYSNETWKIEEVEVPFAVEILRDEEANIRIVLEGKIDLLVTEEKTGVRLVVDHKRVSRNYTPYDRDNQKLAYCLASGRRDFIINQIGTQKSYNVDKRMQRYYFNYSEHQIEEFISNTIDWSLQILKVIDSDKKGYFVKRNYTACNRFNMKCQFYDVCNTTEDNKLYKLEQSFKPKGDFDIFKE